MERWWIVYVLPLEVWMDIFCFPWISREEFGQLVDRIGNFKFAEHAQFYLHEWGKRTLHFHKNGLWKYKSDSNGGDRRLSLAVPQTPLPANIKSFDSIYIYHFDAISANYFAQIRTLLTDVGVSVFASCDYLDNLRAVWTHLTPSLDNIHSLQSCDFTLPVMAHYFREDMAKLKKLKYISFNAKAHVDEAIAQENVNLLMQWLTQPEQEGENVPRLCEIRHHSNNHFSVQFSKQIFMAIREQFLTAKTPCTFAVSLFRGRKQFQFAADEFHLANGIGEELHGKRIEERAQKVFQITRHPANLNTEEVREWIVEAAKVRHCRWIHILQPTIGSIDAADQLGEEEQDDQQQPSTTKDA